MKFIKEIPTVEGYYFYKNNADVITVVYVGENKLGWRLMSQGPCQGYTEYGFALPLFKNAWFAGPIAFPTN